MTAPEPNPGVGTTLKDVARQAGVSIKTASRVLNESPNVSPDTRTRVLAAIQDLGYVPDLAARSLRAGRDRTVGVVVDSIGDVFFAQLVAEVETVLGKGGYRSLIASSNRNVVREVEVVQDMVQRRCAGIIVAPTNKDSLSGLRLGDVPVVFVDRKGDLPGSTSVVADDFELARLATQHLLDHGHRRIALFSDAVLVETTRDRHRGFHAALAAAGVQVDERFIRTDITRTQEVLGALRGLLELDEQPTAILSTNSRLSLGLVPALHQFGRTDIALISFGDFVMADSVSPAVTVINHSPEAIGRAAAEAMLRRLHDGSAAAGADPVILVPAELIPRGSGEITPGATQ